MFLPEGQGIHTDTIVSGACVQNPNHILLCTGRMRSASGGITDEICEGVDESRPFLERVPIKTLLLRIMKEPII